MALPVSGAEWIVDARGCPPSVLRSLPRLRRLLVSMVGELDLHPIGDAAWHQFPGHRGITGFWMLQESHLAVHTFPEFGSICVNLFCCRKRPAWAWKRRLAQLIGAREVEVRIVERRYGDAAESVG